jgi:hypothetical protein
MLEYRVCAEPPTQRRRVRRKVSVLVAGVAVWLGSSALAPSRASAITVVWDSSSTPYPGLRVRRGHSTSPTIYFRAAFASLCNDYVHLRATSPPTSRRTAGSWASSVGVQLAVNGDFFVYGSTPQVYGDAVGGGVHWPASQTGMDDGGWYSMRHGWIAFGPDWVEFSHTRWTKQHAAEYEAAGYTVRQGWQPTTVTTTIPPGTLSLVSGFPELVIEGRAKTCPDPAGSACFADASGLNSGARRTAMGISMDRRTFILVVTESTSVQGRHLAAIMAEIGAWQAFNLDGGGSSQMWLEGQGYLVSSSDTPDRAVTNHWGVFAGAGSGMPQIPGSCDPCVDQVEVCDGIDNNCNGEIDEGMCDHAALSEASSLEDWPACSARELSIRMDNVGGTSWQGADGVGLRFESGPLSAPAFVPVEGVVGPGGVADFSFTAVAGAVQGAGTGRWSMARGEQMFVDPALLPVTITAPLFRSELADLSYAAALREGERAPIWAVFRNTGSEPWPADAVVLGTLPPERASTLWTDSWLAFDVPARIDREIQPGGLGEVSFDVVMTDEAAGTLEAFGLRDPSGTPLGCEAGTLELAMTLHQDPNDAPPGAGQPRELSTGDDAGCGCRAAGTSGRGWVLGLGLLLLRRRRRLREAQRASVATGPAPRPLRPRGLSQGAHGRPAAATASATAGATSATKARAPTELRCDGSRNWCFPK